MSKNLVNKLVANATSGRVQLTRYIRAPIALSMVLHDQEPLHYLREGEMNPFSHSMI